MKHQMINACGGLLSGLAALTASSARADDVSYDAVSRPGDLIVTATGSTNFDLDASKVASGVTNIIKRGDGRIVGRGLTAYEGDITVEGGRWIFYSAEGVGVLVGGGAIRVKNGGTLQVNPVSANGLDITGKTIYVEGSGAAGWMGALYYTGAVTQNSSKRPLGSKVVLTGNASFNFAYECQLYGLTIDMGGLDHTLTFLSTVRLNDGSAIVNPGHISVANGYAIQFAGQVDVAGSAENHLYLGKSAGSGIDFSAATVDIPWTVHPGNRFYASSGALATETAKNVISGPVLLDGCTKVSCYQKTGVQLKGKISGSGNVFLDGSVQNATSNQGWWPFARLWNAENDFTGGVGGSLANLYLATSGALPAEGGDLVLTNSTVYLEDSANDYALPNACFVATGRVSPGNTNPTYQKQETIHVTVDGGNGGSWRERVVKEGDGDLYYKSRVSSPLFDIRAGKMYVQPRNPNIAGLVVGTNKFESAPLSITMFKRTETYTNGIARVFNKRLYGNNVPGASGEEVIGHWGACELLTLSGYVWNNEPTNVVWSFAGTSCGYLSITIDDDRFFYTEEGTSAYVTFADKELSPGPHRIVVRSCPNSSGSGGYRSDATVKDGAGTWNWDRGLCYDPLGRGGKNYWDYQTFLDPGDGSVLTAVLPGESIDNPETGRTESFAPMTFDTVAFAAGASLVFTNWSGSTTFGTLAVKNLVGWPSLERGNVEVSDSWSFDPLTIGDGLGTIPGSLVFGDGCTIDIPDIKPTDRSGREYAVISAAGGITGLPASTSPRWRTRLSQDGKTILLSYNPPGSVLIVR